MDSPNQTTGDVTEAASQPAAETTAAEVGKDQSEASATPQPSEPKVSQGKIDLTSLPEFREVQSRYDRAIAQERKARQELERRLAELNNKLSQRELEDLDSLDPSEQVAKLKRKLNEVQRQQEEERKAAEIITRAQAMVAKAGLNWDDPRLNDIKNSYAPGPEALAALAERIADIAAEEKRAAELAAKKAAEEAQRKLKETEQRARVEQAAQSGAAMTSLSSPTPQLGDEREQKVKHFRARFSQLRGKGISNPEYLRLLSEMRAAGLSINDLGY